MNSNEVKSRLAGGTWRNWREEKGCKLERPGALAGLHTMVSSQMQRQMWQILELLLEI